MAMLSPETNFMLTLCDPVLLHDPAAAARRLKAIGPVDWPTVFANGQRQRVLPLMADRMLRLQTHIPEVFPAEAMFFRSVQQMARDAKFVEMRFLSVIHRISVAMKEAGIRVVVIKGLAVSERAFGSFGLRTNRDIDLLVATDQILAARGVLEQMGQVMVEPATDTDDQGLLAWLERSKDLVFQDQARGIIVELHHRLFDNSLIDMPWVFDRAVPIALAGSVEILALDPTDELKYLALHGSLHAWSRMKWLLDLAYLLRPISSTEIAALLHQRKDHPGTLALQASIVLCQKLFPGEVGPSVQTPPFRTRILNAIWRKIMLGYAEREIEDTRFGTTLKNASVYLLLRTWPAVWERLLFDLTTDADKTKVFQRKRLSHAWLRLPNWLWHRIFGPAKHALRSNSKRA